VATIARVTAVALCHALTGPSEPPLRPLPDRVNEMLVTLDAPPRLAAHLRAVHDVAWQLTRALASRCPHLTFDREAVLFGAATHDIGKIVHVGELSGPGSAHELAGYRLLLQRGVDEALARFARTHASWQLAEIGVEDLLVSLADKVWKGKRVADLEQKVVDRIVESTGREPWQAFMELDDILDRLAAGADQRLAFQASHTVHTGTAMGA
jgi:HD domain